ncbi:MAG: ABC transporter substrate-binding protein [Thermoanaerobaculia bacterium]|nr:ABC transporter substrate-binding protein [Thermoanaerobaculia bacterium]
MKIVARALRPVALTALAAAVAAGAGCGGGRQGEAANELVVALRSAPIHLDPRVATDQASSRVFEVALNGLVTKDPEGNFLPDLAERWEILDQGRRWRFHLRPGVRFHDGRELAARDVVWTFRTILDGTVTTVKRAALPRLERVTAVDDLTVDFELDQPFGPMLADLTCFLGIVPDGSTPEANDAALVGTGPFRVVERRPDTVVLEAFDDHWRGRPAIDRLTLRAVPDATVRVLELRKGSVNLAVNDLPPDVVAQMRDDPKFQVVEDPGSNYAYIGLNLEDPLLARPEVRRAIYLAIDRERLVGTLWRGLGWVTETMIPPGHWAHHDGLPRTPHDPAAARELLDTAGLADPDGDGPRPRFRLTFKTSTEETYLLQAQIIQSMLAEVGIEVEIRSYEFATFYDDVKRGNFQMFSLVWTGIVDPNIYALTLHSERVPPAGSNRGRYRNPAFDRLIEEGARRIDPAERRSFYLEAQEIFARDLPYLSLYIKATVGVMSAGLEGYANYTSGELYSVREMRWRERG